MIEISKLSPELRIHLPLGADQERVLLSSEDDDAKPKRYGPGSYALQPSGQVHAEANVCDGELVALVYFDGPVDIVLDE